ncbi:MAG TPA: hypothetical protein VK186_00940, partial [Candidatus Deferrimicrobium sp.]|nr:hypothetical protein [Candidatus Deferrimicrobium sp.]
NIMEYNFYRKNLKMDFLASFTYIPGTVVFFGYGSLLEKTQWDPTTREYLYSSRLNEMQRSFFFKISYLWRL